MTIMIVSHLNQVKNLHPKDDIFYRKTYSTALILHKNDDAFSSLHIKPVL